jgi:predicted regulator of Ras-like GTPase activity (Roadblock/LC7/MglB family)
MQTASKPRWAKHTFLLLIILFSLVLLGCVQKNVYPSQKETVVSERSIDTDGDGLPDEIIYVFQNRTVGTVTVHREILVQRNVGNEVVTRINIVSEATDKISNIVLQEVIPTPLASSVEKVDFVPKYSELVRKEPPVTVVWRFTFGAGQEIGKTIEYTAVAFQEINPAWIDRFVQSPSIEVEEIDPKAVPVYVQLSELNALVYGGLQNAVGFYFATAIYGSLLIVLLLILVEIATVLFATARSAVKKTEFRSELLKLIGHGRRDNYIWIALGIILAIIGTTAIAMTEETPATADLVIAAKLASNFPKTIGISLFVLGIVSIYYSLADMVKGAVLGERYYMSPLDMARARLRQLLDTVDRLERDISEEAAYGIDTEAESIVAEVERNKSSRIGRELNEENSEYYVKPLVNSIDNVQSSIDSLESKHEVFTHWQEWRKSMDGLLVSNDQISPEMLADVPVRWRKWALTRYMSEHLGEALTIEEGVLKKIKIAAVGKGEIELILTDFLRAGKIEGVAVMRKDGLVISSFMPRDIDPNLIAAIGAKVMANTEMSSMELELGKPRFVLIKAGGQDTIIYSGKALVTIALARQGESIGYVVNEMGKLVERLDALI